MKELERIKDNLKSLLVNNSILEDAIEEIDMVIIQSENGAQKRSKREAALLDEVESLKVELDKSQKAFESIKEEAIKAMDVATDLLHQKEELEKALEELKIEKRERDAKKALSGKYRQEAEKSHSEPKKGFRIKED